MTSRLWLGVAAACLAISLAFGYHHDQVTADKVIALHSAPPPPVLLQEFDPETHSNTADEVRIYAEVDPGAPISITVTNDTGQEQAAVLYPLFPVSAVGKAKLREHLSLTGAPPRPVPRTAIVGEKPAALGFVVRFAASEAEAARQVELAFGRGLAGGSFGRVVEVKGQQVNPGNLGFVAQGAIAAMGGQLAADVVSIQPFTHSRTEAIASAPGSLMQQIFQRLAVLSALLAVFASLAPGLPWPGRVPRRTSQPKLPGHTSFSPIATQDEITRADAEAALHPLLKAAVDWIGRVRITAIDLAQSCLRSRL